LKVIEEQNMRAWEFDWEV